jgi:two-component system, chemotaxis family, CheB/CheR fusion protein
LADPDSKPPHEGEGFFVVGIGASAGGIAPLREFFSKAPRDSGMAYVVILHLSAAHESNLPELLQARAKIPVTQVTGPVRVEANHVYVIPPQKYLVMADGMIRLTDPQRTRGAHTSIDLFFRTLADAYGKNALAILLSGTGADGTLGLARIKEQGGFVIVQDPAETEHSDMARSAIDAGLVDRVLPVADMPDKLLSLRDGARRLVVPDGDDAEDAVGPVELDETDLRNISSLLRLRTGHDFSHYRRPTLLRRIARRMQVHETVELGAYLDLPRANPDEVTALLRDLLITVTNFFRDAEAFEALEQTIIPLLFEGKGPNDQVRVWSVGCATGDEAYSLAILLAERASRLSQPPQLQVFATDIDERAIIRAREGRYPETIALDVSPARLSQFFTRVGSQYQVKKQLRELILFAPHNVLRDPPFSQLDLVSCRNLLIYLNREMQSRVLEIFHFAIRDEGFLFLGASESAENLPALFTPTDKKYRHYRRRATVGTILPAPNLVPGRWQLGIGHPEPRDNMHGISAGQLHQEIVEQLAPPSVLVNEEDEIVHTSASAGRYLRIGGGEPTRNVLKLVHPSLQLDLRSALLEARLGNHTEIAASRRVRANLDGEVHWVDLSVRKVLNTQGVARDMVLIIFDERTEPSMSAPPMVEKSDEVSVVEQFEQELQRTKDQLRLTIEQYETSTEELRASNEELQAVNEELRSATEELETSKEELQSINEELSTVNGVQGKDRRGRTGQ